MNTMCVTVKKIWVSIVVAALLFIASAATSFAQSYYYPTYTTYPTYSNAADQQALLSQLYALLAQLQALQGYATPYYGVPTYAAPVYVTPTYTYTSYSDTEYDVTVYTEDIDTRSDDSVLVTGEVDLNGASYAYVWFEYGENAHISEQTNRVKSTGDISFTALIDNLDDDQQYYVRAVAEDPTGYRSYAALKGFEINDSNNSHDDDDNSNEEIPDVNTSNATNIDSYQAELWGSVAMNDFEDGVVFFVYGEDEDEVDAVEDEDSYSDIDEDGNDLQKISLYSNLDGDRSFGQTVYGLDAHTDYFYKMCVEYEDEDRDQTLECGNVENFETDN